MSAEPLTPFGSALAGALGAVFSNAVVYPLDTVKTRLQALPSSSGPALPIASTGKDKHGLRAAEVPAYLIKRLRRFKMLSLLLSIIRTEGLGGVFKGFSANMLNTFSQQFAYFFFHTLLRKRVLASRATSRTSPSTRQSLSTSVELLLGALAGALAQIFTIPVAVIATRQQLHTPSAAHPSAPAPGFTETAREIIRESGPTGLWTGLRPGLVLTVNPAITYGVFERLKSALIAGRGASAGDAARLGVGEAFWLGVGSKTLATVVTYPYIFAKVRLQAKVDTDDSPTDDSDVELGTAPKDPLASTQHTETAVPGGQAQGDPEAAISGDQATYAQVAAQAPASSPLGPAPQSEQSKRRHRHRGAVALLLDVYRQHGLAGWYQGLEAQIVKAVLCQGILFVSKDQFEVYAAVILAVLARFRQRLSKQL